MYVSFEPFVWEQVCTQKCLKSKLLTGVYMDQMSTSCLIIWYTHISVWSVLPPFFGMQYSVSGREPGTLLCTCLAISMKHLLFIMCSCRFWEWSPLTGWKRGERGMSWIHASDWDDSPIMRRVFSGWLCGRLQLAIWYAVIGSSVSSIFSKKLQWQKN